MSKFAFNHRHLCGVILGLSWLLWAAYGGILPAAKAAGATPPPKPPRRTETSPNPASPTPAPQDKPENRSSITTREKGRIEETDLRSPLLQLPMEVLIYLPPAYDQETERRYPVLYMVHGQNYTEDQWDRVGADETADRLISSGEVAPFIIVMPHDRLWTNPDASPFGTVFLESLIPWVDNTYRTKTERQKRAIGGLSRGAAWAVHLGISDWQKFGIIGVHSGFYFLGEEYQTRKWLQAIPPESMPRMFVDIGAGDHLLSANQQLEEMLMENNIPHEYYLYPGRHEEVYWSSHVEQYLRWYAADW